MGSLSSVVLKKLFIKLLSYGRVRNVAENFDDPEPNDHHATPSISPRVACCLNFHHSDSKRSSHDVEELGKLTVRVVAVSCKVLLAFTHRVKTRNQTFNNFSFCPDIRNSKLDGCVQRAVHHSIYHYNCRG